MSTETTHSKASIVPSSTPGQPITNSLRLYIGLWFPFGINNVVFLGEQLHEHALRLKANPWGSFSGCDYPARMGNEISWKFWLSVHSKGTNYHIEVLLIWNGNGYLHCEADIKNQQNGS